MRCVRMFMILYDVVVVFFFVFFVFFQAEDGIRDLVRSRGLGDVYKRQGFDDAQRLRRERRVIVDRVVDLQARRMLGEQAMRCLLYTSDAADERSKCRSRGSPYHLKKKKIKKKQGVPTLNKTKTYKSRTSGA